jgi:cation:H+ antiporter
VTATSTLLAVFVAGAGVSLGASWLLVTRLERVGATLGFSEALLGMVAAVAADAPEITSAITALAGHEPKIGAGVVIGSNVFNLAALLGVSALVAGHIVLDRRVIELEGAVALWIAVVCVTVVVGLVSAGVGLVAVLVVFVPYLAILGVHHDRLRRLGLPRSWADWLTGAIVEEEAELKPAIHPSRGSTKDAVGALIAVVTVVVASIAMEKTTSRLGAGHHIPDIVVGGLVLAAVTSLPNAVAAVYLARRGRGAATLSTAMNSNAQRHHWLPAAGRANRHRGRIGVVLAGRRGVFRGDRSGARLCLHRQRPQTDRGRHDHRGVPRVRRGAAGCRVAAAARASKRWQRGRPLHGASRCLPRRCAGPNAPARPITRLVVALAGRGP